MARKTIIVSDISGREIDDKDAAKVTITYADARRGQVVLDVNASEVEEWASKRGAPGTARAPAEIERLAVARLQRPPNSRFQQLGQ